MITANQIIDYMFISFGVILLITFAACMASVIYCMWKMTTNGGNHD